MLPLFALSGMVSLEKRNTGISDANKGNRVESAIFAQTLLHCPGRCVSAQLCSQPACGSDPLSGLIRHTESWRLWFISHESHLFLPGRYVIITDLPAPSCWKQAVRIWIFHYSMIIPQICHRIWFMQAREDVHTLLYHGLRSVTWREFIFTWWIING